MRTTLLLSLLLLTSAASLVLPTMHDTAWATEPEVIDPDPELATTVHVASLDEFWATNPTSDCYIVVVTPKDGPQETHHLHIP